MDDAYFMREAIKDAKANYHQFGAVIVKDGKIIAKSGKRPKNDPRFHAETQAIFNAGEALGKDLTGCTLYTTCEPCVMCFYMAWITNISRIVYGTSIKDSIDVGLPEINISVEELNKRVNNPIELKGNFLRDECLDLLKEIHKK
jgi:tRNA(Arg) A34 adenosine deaminase TadA